MSCTVTSYLIRDEISRRRSAHNDGPWAAPSKGRHWTAVDVATGSTLIWFEVKVYMSQLARRLIAW